jgi:hypothetical protein
MTRRSKLFCEFIFCACGCGKTRPRYTAHRTEAKFILGHNNPGYKGGEFKSRGYKFKFVPEYHLPRKKKYVRVHRLVYEAAYNCCLLPWADLHHVNEVRDDNRINNLLPALKPEHTKLHNPKKDHSKTICLRCKSSTTWVSKNGRKHWYKWKDGYICAHCYDDKIDKRWIPE